MASRASYIYSLLSCTTMQAPIISKPQDNVFFPAEDGLKTLRQSHRLLIWDGCTFFPLWSCALVPLLTTSPTTNTTTTPTSSSSSRSTATPAEQHITASPASTVLVAERKVMLRLMKLECWFISRAGAFMHEEVLGAKFSKKRSRSPCRSHASAFHPREGYYFLPRHSELCGCFLFGWFQFSPQKTFGGIFKVIHVPKKKRKVGRTAAETGKPTQPLFHCGVSRDGRDYGRITLHNMDALNQIKEETIKARVKATAVSSFICLPPPALPEQECCPRLNCFHPQSPLIWDPHKPSFFFLHEHWTEGPDINPLKQSKQGR